MTDRRKPVIQLAVAVFCNIIASLWVVFLFNGRFSLSFEMYVCAGMIFLLVWAMATLQVGEKRAGIISEMFLPVIYLVPIVAIVFISYEESIPFLLLYACVLALILSLSDFFRFWRSRTRSVS